MENTNDRNHKHEPFDIGRSALSSHVCQGKRTWTKGQMTKIVIANKLTKCKSSCPCTCDLGKHTWTADKVDRNHNIQQINSRQNAVFGQPSTNWYPSTIQLTPCTCALAKPFWTEDKDDRNHNTYQMTTAKSLTLVTCVFFHSESAHSRINTICQTQCTHGQ